MVVTMIQFISFLKVPTRLLQHVLRNMNEMAIDVYIFLKTNIIPSTKITAPAGFDCACPVHCDGRTWISRGAYKFSRTDSQALE